jgi:hypothetical protein
MSPTAEQVTDSAAPLPPDAITVHIGMMKTGTTALQTLFAAAREDMKRLGVDYPGGRKLLEHHAAAFSLLGLADERHGFKGGAGESPDEWSALADHARRTPSRVLISSEHFSAAGPKQIQRLVCDLGPDRVQVVVGVRNLAPIAVSVWQETLKARWTSDLDAFMSDQFKRQPKEDGAWSFWARHDSAAVVRRWADAEGSGRVRAVIIDERDRSFLQRTFEQLLELPEGTLAGRTPAMSNRGMSADEAELVRRVNLAVESLDWHEYESLVRYGMIRRLVENRSLTADDAKPTLPEWAMALATEEGQRLAREITAAGVGVIGDLNNLVVATDNLTRSVSAAPRTDRIPMEAAVEAVVGIAARATRGSWRLDSPRPTKTKNGPSAADTRVRKKAPVKVAPRRPAIDELRTRELLGLVVSRAWRGIRRRASNRRSRHR